MYCAIRAKKNYSTPDITGINKSYRNNSKNKTRKILIEILFFGTLIMVE
ncbi:MAG: hypothetical protein JETT_1722 [Candidatus Jettenia ecosi]|uniref:Uncharacterized protein n=1 Tax=Candidatus Jettenia ecosi TaxID=2494326 RepID=A0A533QBB7_9BACT|nr:MAG: hypothetical protein JETT_1722 [Candidatus Jettenia ecosi]